MVFRYLLIAFILVPIIEIYLLFQVGEVIGGGWTILLIIITAIIGASLLQRQGLSTLHRINQSVAQGELPPAMLVEGLLLLFAGALLLTPGFFTDAVGFSLLLPPLRHWLATLLLRHGLFIMAAGPANHPPPPGSGAGRTYEGEYERRDD